MRERDHGDWIIKRDKRMGVKRDVLSRNEEKNFFARAGEMEGRLIIFECYLEFFKCDPLDKTKLYRDSFRELKLILIKLIALLATDQTWLSLDRDIAVFSQGYKIYSLLFFLFSFFFICLQFLWITMYTNIGLFLFAIEINIALEIEYRIWWK